MHRFPFRMTLLWPVMAAAFAYGVLEWTALTRSRWVDRLSKHRGRFAP
jgi:hypothetical protein